MSGIKPFLFLAARAETVAADGEYQAICRFMGLPPEQLVRIRLDAEPLPALDFNDYSGIIIGGSPFNVSDDAAAKTQVQRRVEAELESVLTQAIAADYPVLGLCYGMGLLGQVLGVPVNREYGEEASVVQVQLTETGLADPLLAGIPAQFSALTGHKEAVAQVPTNATVLATSSTAPVQMLRAGANVYAVQFHPELDEAGLTERLAIYLENGYCKPEEYDQVIARIHGANLTYAHQTLRNFATRYAR